MSIFERHLDKVSPIPLYYQIKQHLLSHIAESAAGEPLPTETALCEHFQVSRPTVRQAISELVQEGYVYRTQGKGTFIFPRKIDRSFNFGLATFNEEMTSKGMSPQTAVLETKIVAPEAAKLGARLKAGGADSGPVFFLRRLRSVDNCPLMVVDSYLPYHLLPKIERKDFTEHSLHGVLQNDYGLLLTKCIRSLEPVSLPPEEAELLQVQAGLPAQYVETLTYLKDGTVIEHSEAWYRGDIGRFTFEFGESGLRHSTVELRHAGETSGRDLDAGASEHDQGS